MNWWEIKPSDSVEVKQLQYLHNLLFIGNEHTFDTHTSPNSIEYLEIGKMARAENKYWILLFSKSKHWCKRKLAEYVYEISTLVLHL